MDNTSSQKIQEFSLDALNLSHNHTNEFSTTNGAFELYHKPGDPDGVNRLAIRFGDFQAEFFPSKGLSLGQAFYQREKLFWDAPYDLPNPNTLDLWSDEVLINNKAMKGFTFLKTFSSGIEFYGLKNWGMPIRDEKSGEQLLLHGETSNIPIEKVAVKICDTCIEVTGTLLYHDMRSADSSDWFKKGMPLYSVEKYYCISIQPEPKITIKDRIKNITEKVHIPDWGYHITFFPHTGSKLMVPSGKVMVRGGGKLPEDVETWTPSTTEASREETGIIHQHLKTNRQGDSEVCEILLQHTTGKGLFCSFTPSPYFQTWSCKGGAGSNEFKLKTGESLMKKNWDGLGIEIGTSALDHDGNTDPSVSYEASLEPGESKTISIGITPINKKECLKVAGEISDYNKNRQ